jgi:hypothetical protein
MEDLMSWDISDWEKWADLREKLAEPKKLVWAVRSESDKRWNKEWHVTGHIVEGPPRELVQWVLKQTEELGEDPPNDCMMSCWKED